MRLPASLTEIDKDWLAAALSTSFPGARLRSAALVKAHSGTTGRARYGLEWADTGDAEPLPATVFVKLPPVDDVQKETVVEWDMGRREARFYRFVGPTLAVPAPRCFFSDWSEDGRRYVMLFEDLRESGARPATARLDATYQRAAQVVGELARIHAAFWNSARFEADLAWLDSFMILRTAGTFDLLSAALDAYRDRFPPAFAEAGELILANRGAIVDALCRGIPTLVHGDCHVGNLYVTADDRTGFLDWALCSRLPAMWDVSYFLCNSLPSEIRRAKEDELLQIYAEAFHAAGGPARSMDELRADYRFYALYAWVSPVVTIGAGSRMQPSDLMLEGVARATNALAELGSLAEARRRLTA